MWNDRPPFLLHCETGRNQRRPRKELPPRTPFRNPTQELRVHRRCHLDGTNVQDLQNFIADSKWDEAAVFAHVARQANDRIGKHRNTMLCVDESGFSKKGLGSAGVARQYNGRLGKTDNCQVGVFSVLSNGTDAAIIGARLLLPAEWVDDPERCLKAGIPAERIKPATKIDLVRERDRRSRRPWSFLRAHWHGQFLRAR